MRPLIVATALAAFGLSIAIGMAAQDRPPL